MTTKPPDLFDAALIAVLIAAVTLVQIVAMRFVLGSWPTLWLCLAAGGTAIAGGFVGAASARRRARR